MRTRHLCLVLDYEAVSNKNMLSGEKEYDI